MNSSIQKVYIIQCILVIMSLTDLLINIPWRMVRQRRRLTSQKNIELYMLSCGNDKKEYFVSKMDELKRQYWDVSTYEEYVKE